MIKFDSEKQTFILNTKDTCYAFKIAYGRYLIHLYYGERGGSIDFGYMPPKVSFMTAPKGMEDGNFSLETIGSEYAYYGTGDFRTSSVSVRTPCGDGNVLFFYENHRIFDGGVSLGALPCARAGAGVQTLEIVLFDAVCRCRLYLYYTVYERENIIARSVKIKNENETPVTVEKCMSLCFDLCGGQYDILTLYGSYGNEMQLRRNPIFAGNQRLESRRGATGHNYNPFIAVCDSSADYDSGSVYGFNLVYSGNFLSEAELTSYTPASFVPYDMLRIQSGINPEGLSFRLSAGEIFYAPQAIMTYSAEGINKMSQNFHVFVRSYIMPENTKRPIVLNTWEACYYDIHEEKLLAFAEECKKIGIDTLVVDDGWFGKRDNETCSLGDWTVNTKKFKNGLKDFSDKICKHVCFGIWIEPEMLSEQSELYRVHPDWVLGREDRPHTSGRHQLVLDLTNSDVIRYLKKAFSDIFENIDVSYIKWDMNRNLTEVASKFTPMSSGETAYRYLMGVYDLLRWFKQKFPNAVFETCSGGGGRFDLGMAAFSSMIWTSDNTSPEKRIFIQAGALTAYPAALMSCHVSAPKENGDVKEFSRRFVVAAQGILGYELDLCRVSEKVKELFAEQIRKYNAFRHLIENGKYAVVFHPDSGVSAYYYFSEKEILFTVFADQNVKEKIFPVKDADGKASYREYFSGETVMGKMLNDGRFIRNCGDSVAEIKYFVKEEN